MRTNFFRLVPLARLASLALVPVALGLSACGPAETPPDPPVYLRIRLLDLTLGPTKADGSAWDGGGVLIPPADLALIAEAMGAPDAAVAVAEALATPALDGLDKPDVVGKATLFASTGEVPAQAFTGQENSLRPTLNPSPTWERVEFDGQLRLEVTLTDDDLVGSDPIGTFILNAEALREAARQNKVYQVRVAEQTGNTVLFVGVIVSSIQ